MAAPRPDAGIAGDLVDYVARRYDPVLGRFIQPDTIVPDPGDPQALNRYSYVGNNPVRYTDPSGHCIPELNCPGDEYSQASPVAKGAHTIITTNGYIIDIRHFIVALANARKTMKHIAKGDEFVRVSRASGFGPLRFGQSYEYRLSERISASQRSGVAMGILIDSSFRFEHFQSWGGQTSVYSFEDIPSDYLGYVAGIKGMSLMDILDELGEGWKEYKLESDHPPMNFSYQPVFPITDNVWIQGNWPPSLDVAPIESSSGLWSHYDTDAYGKFVAGPIDVTIPFGFALSPPGSPAQPW